MSGQPTLLVYDPLWIGTDVLYDTLAFEEESVQQQRELFGGYHSRSFTLPLQQSEVEEWLEFGLGRHIEVYSDNLMMCFEGFVNRIDANIGALSLSRGPLLGGVANRVRVDYSTVDNSITPPAMGIRVPTAWANDTASQAKYGIIERVIGTSGATAANAELIRDLEIIKASSVRGSESDNLSSSSIPTVSIEVMGYWHWLQAYIYSSASGAQVGGHTKIQSVLAADTNSIFSTDYSGLSTNATITVSQWEDEDRTGFEVIRNVVNKGDSSNDPWLFYLGPGRKAYYHVAPSEATYQRALLDPRQSMRRSSGALVEPWDMTTGEWIFYTDVFIGSSPTPSIRTDPHYLFVENAAVTYPASLTVQGIQIHRIDQFLSRLGLRGS